MNRPASSSSLPGRVEGPPELPTKQKIFLGRASCFGVWVDSVLVAEELGIWGS